MYEFQWIAPIEVSLMTVPGIRDREPEADREFWACVESLLSDNQVNFPRSSGVQSGLAYTQATGDELPRPLEIAHGIIPMIPTDNTSSQCDLRARTLSWTLFDHGVLLVEGNTQAPLLPHEDPEQAARRLENEIQQFAEELCEHTIRPRFAALANAIEAAPRHERHVILEPATDANGSTPVRWTGPKWVSRAVLIDPADARAEEFARAWMEGINNDTCVQMDEFIAQQRVNVAEWMNYVYSNQAHDVTPTLWQALRRAQYFYAATMNIDERLRYILSWSMAEKADLSLNLLRQELEHAINQAQELILIRAEVGKYGNRHGHTEMKRILDCWDFDEILDSPVRQKLRLCRERLDSLASDRAARSAMFTDIILMTIGVTSILATAIALVQFGRESSTDADQANLDLARGNITYWLSSQSIDAIVLVSAIVSLALLLIFTWKRRQSLS